MISCVKLVNLLNIKYIRQANYVNQIQHYVFLLFDKFSLLQHALRSFKINKLQL